MKAHLAQDAKRILELLYQASNGLHSYTIYKMSRLPVYQILSVLDKLVKNDYIIIEEEHITLTSKGKEEALRYFQIAEGRGVAKRNLCPKEFSGPRLDIETPYVPLVNKLDRKLRI